MASKKYAMVIGQEIRAVFEAESIAHMTDIVDLLEEIPDGLAVHVDWTYQDGQFVPPPVPRVVVSVEDFRRRFTDQELSQIANSSDPVVKVLLLKLQTRSTVELEDPALVTGVSYLISLFGWDREEVLARILAG